MHLFLQAGGIVLRGCHACPDRPGNDSGTAAATDEHIEAGRGIVLWLTGDGFLRVAHWDA